MSKPLISLGYFTQNSLLVLENVVKRSMWADKIYVLDMNSSDGSYEFCKKTLRPQDVYVRRKKNTMLLSLVVILNITGTLFVGLLLFGLEGIFMKRLSWESRIRRR